MIVCELKYTGCYKTLYKYFRRDDFSYESKIL